MKISDYSYELPEELIAQFPPEVRGSTRLLVLDRGTGNVQHRHYGDVFEYLGPGDVVILNNTKVIKARLVALNSRGQKRELLLLEEHAGSDPYKRRVMYRGKLVSGETLTVGGTKVTIDEVLAGGIAVIASESNLLELASTTGSVPLPPYMHRDATEADIKRYQTVFAKNPGSVAAPTASLNFTKELEKKIVSRGAKVVYLTLHVGLGTFLPIRADRLEDHVMHSEYFEIPAETAQVIRATQNEGRKILAVGTTVARTLEFASDQILNEPKLKTPKKPKSHFTSLLEDSPQSDDQNVICGEANIFIYPGYKFKLVNMLITNFHAPKSTVLMLAASFAGHGPERKPKGWDNLQHAYAVAVKEKYAFLSYGDSMLIL